MVLFLGQVRVPRLTNGAQTVRTIVPPKKQVMTTLRTCVVVNMLSKQVEFFQYLKQKSAHVRQLVSVAHASELKPRTGVRLKALKTTDWSCSIPVTCSPA